MTFYVTKKIAISNENIDKNSNEIVYITNFQWKLWWNKKNQ